MDRKGPDECWPWTGGKQGNGYGQFYRHKREPIGAHRFAWQLEHGQPVPAGRMVMHSCDNPPCVNPAHLTVGTAADNRRDCSQKGRNPGNRTKGRPGIRKVDPEQVRALRAAGLTYDQIGAALNVSKVTAWRNDPA